ncbi:DUF5713 family protein [Streptomyces sp. CO7]
MAGHAFLAQTTDPYCPQHVVDKGRAVLRSVCERIEAERPSGLPALYVLTGVVTEEHNARHSGSGTRGPHASPVLAGTMAP